MSDARQARLERFALQSAARELLPDERVSYCMRRVIPNPDGGDAGVGVWYSESVHKAHYKGLMTCGSVWTCPVCSSKISERRRVELTEALEWATETDFDAYLLTFTLHHDRTDNLSKLLDDLLAAYRRMKAGKRWAMAEKKLGIVGSIRALEVTYSDRNLWHPHCHTVLITRKGADIKEIEAFFKSRWLAVLKREGRFCDDEHGFKISGARYTVAEYLQKFGREPAPSRWIHEHELCKQPVKSAYGEHMTPIALLRAYLHGDERAGRLWRQYAMCFKGKRQLVWSRGLRKLLGLSPKEATDQELAEAVEQDAALLATLSLKQWRAILAHDCRGELLEIAHDGDAAKVMQFVNDLTGDLSLPARDARAACDGELVNAVVCLDRRRRNRVELNQFLAEMADSRTNV